MDKLKSQHHHCSSNERSTYVNDNEIKIILLLDNKSLTIKNKDYLNYLIKLINRYSWNKNTNENNYLENIQEIMTHPKIGINNFIDEINIANTIFRKENNITVSYKLKKLYKTIKARE